RRTRADPPEKIVGELDLARLPEAEHGGALRVHGVEHVAHHAVLAAGVEGLQYDEQRLVTVRIQQVLQLAQALEVLLDLRPRLFVRYVLTRVGGVDLAESNLLP